MMSALRQTSSRIWHSPTLMTATSVLVRGLSVLLVLPLLLTRLTAAEVAVWYLFLSIISLQVLADLGFAPTFSRVIAYGMGGALRISGVRGTAAERLPSPNWALLSRIWGSMRVVYRRVTALSVVALGVLGTSALIRPVGALTDSQSAWQAWTIIVIVSGTTLWGGAYAAVLQGANEVALLRRWETASNLAAIVTSFLVLLLGGRLLALVIANQGWAAFNVMRNRVLARRVLKQLPVQPAGVDREVMDAVWGSAWRSGVGIGMARGATHASGLLLAQSLTPAALAAYLLALRFVQLIADLSQAPFYSRLPMLARMQTEGAVASLISQARRGMRMALWSFAAGAWLVAIAATPALSAIGSSVEFVRTDLWALLAMGFFVERYGAMHLQLYSTTNHIVWHIAAGIAAALNVTVSLLLLHALGAYAFALGQLAGAAGFYAWYSARLSYRAFGLQPWSFESGVAIPPTALMMVMCAGAALGWLP